MASALRLNTLLGRQFQSGDRLLEHLRNELKLLDGLCQADRLGKRLGCLGTLTQHRLINDSERYLV